MKFCIICGGMLLQSEGSMECSTCGRIYSGILISESIEEDEDFVTTELSVSIESIITREPKSPERLEVQVEIPREKEEVLLVPLALGGEDFSEFPLDALPIDPSIIGTAHSHPVHELEPSEEDLNESYGHISFIIAYPYSGARDVAAYSSSGERLKLRIV